jgi:glycosyltransferase involved in cell wall biosynthesis
MLSLLQVTPALDAGGVERTTIEIAEAVARAGGKPLVASRGGRMETELARVGGELVRMSVDTKNPFGIWLNAGRLARLAQDRGVEIIHARSRACGWSAKWAARRLGLPFVTTYHGIYNARSALKRRYNRVMAEGDLVIANSEYTRAHIVKEHRLTPTKVIAIPRGVDLDRFDRNKVDADRVRRARIAMGLGEVTDSRPIVFLPARLTSWKGQTLLIQAAHKLGVQRPGIARYVIAGDSQGRDAYVRQLEEQIAQLGLNDTVHLVGHIDDIPAAYMLADVAVFPSLEPEAFGRGAIEAQAMAVPVIAAAHGGLTETVVDGQTGRLIAPRDPDALAAAMGEMLAATRERRAEIGLRGAQRVKSLYSTSALQQATLAVYARLLRSKK